MTQISLSMKQTHRHREQICDCQREWGGEGWAGNVGLQMQTIVNKADEQQGPSV